MENFIYMVKMCLNYYEKKLPSVIIKKSSMTLDTMYLLPKPKIDPGL